MCENSLPTKLSLAIHLSQNHSRLKIHSDFAQKEEELKRIDEFDCTLCDKKFPSKWNLKRHLKKVHNIQEIEGKLLFITYLWGVARGGPWGQSLPGF